MTVDDVIRRYFESAKRCVNKCSDKLALQDHSCLHTLATVMNNVERGSRVDLEISVVQYRQTLYEIYKTLGFDCGGDPTPDAWINLRQTVLEAAQEYRKDADQNKEQLAVYQKNDRDHVIMGVGDGSGRLFVSGPWEAINRVRQWMHFYEKNHGRR